MNSKGFTLIELLLTIAILGLIMGIAIPSYNGISNAVRENQRKNIIDKILVAASRYAYDTGETIIFVDKLVTEGYIQSDNEEGIIKDPLNNDRLNCYIVKMEKANDYYRANFNDEKYEVNGVCDINRLKESSEDVYIQVTNKSSIISDTSHWLTGNVELKAISKNTLIIDCNVNKCEWASSSGISSVGIDNYTISNIDGELESRYTFQYTIYEEGSSKVKRYKASVYLRIDNEAPLIYGDQIVISDRFVETSSKTVKVVASDGNGSGIAGYYLGSSSSNCENTSIEYQESNEFLVTANGSYKICVKDNVGKFASAILNINNIVD